MQRCRLPSLCPQANDRLLFQICLFAVNCVTLLGQYLFQQGYIDVPYNTTRLG